MKRILVLTAVLVLGLVTTANAVTFVDNDEAGVSHLDIHYSTRTLRPSQPLVTFRINTYDGWRLPYCYDANCSIVWELDTRSGRAVDRLAYWYVARLDSGLRPLCEVYNRHTGTLIGYGTATKYRHNAFCSFPKAWLDKSKDIRWRDLTTAVNDHDVAPDIGFYVGANE